MCKDDPKVWNLSSSLASSLVDRWHFPMVNDQRRNEAFKCAIEKNVQRGVTSVLDIGAGSALLRLVAFRDFSKSRQAFLSTKTDRHEAGSLTTVFFSYFGESAARSEP